MLWLHSFPSFHSQDKSNDSADPDDIRLSSNVDTDLGKICAFLIIQNPALHSFSTFFPMSFLY